MDVQTARWLVSPDAAAAIAGAGQERDPASLAAATRLRRLLPPERAAAVLELVTLRRRARAKLGDIADRLFLTPHGLEQATRPVVARRRAARLAQGADAVVDLGCGLGLDAVALADAGLAVRAVELDPVTAVFASANLSQFPDAAVHPGDVVDLAPGLLAGGAAAFVDPARRTAAGRTWRVEDLTPPWAFALSVLDGSRPAVAKLAPGLPHAVLPDHVEAEWVSDAGQVVETALWAGAGAHPGRRSAVVDGQLLVRDAREDEPEPGPLGRYLYEPDGAVLRAGLVGRVAVLVGGHRVHDQVAYLTSDHAVTLPWATRFEILEVLPYAEKVLRAWVRDRRIGTLEIKKRGIDVDPAVLRKRLRPAGPVAATLVLTPGPSGAMALVCRRDTTAGTQVEGVLTER